MAREKPWLITSNTGLEAMRRQDTFLARPPMLHKLTFEQSTLTMESSIGTIDSLPLLSNTSSSFGQPCAVWYFQKSRAEMGEACEPPAQVAKHCLGCTSGRAVGSRNHSW